MIPQKKPSTFWVVALRDDLLSRGSEVVNNYPTEILIDNVRKKISKLTNKYR